MARGARGNIGPTRRDAGFNQGLALLEAALRHIGDETGPRIAENFGLVRVHWSFDDALT
jgi:hypothetical protein